MPKLTKNDVLLVGVLDESGSMGGAVQEVTKGFNSLVEDQVAQKGTTYVSLVLFSDGPSVRYVATDARHLPALGSPENPYRPHGMTALYDAVAAAITGTERWLATNPFKGKVVVVVWTDGGENASVEFGTHRYFNGGFSSGHLCAGLPPRNQLVVNSGIDRLNAMIDAKKEEGWIFQFMGSGESAWLAARDFTSITHKTFLNSTPDSYVRAYGDFSGSVSASRLGGTYNAVASDAGAGV